MHIPIVSPIKIEKEHPDYILILAWNFAESIIKKLDNYKKSGGKFIIPVPKPVIV
ncbi:MAG: C-methyltransferase [uncultured bacterium]|nr:MAG: C-methyltransferase [uncultured bacterium]